MRKGLLDDLRDTSLEVVAAYADSYHRVTSRFDPRGEPCPPDEPRGDFLYDVVRLQLTHLNELARLGAAYSFIPARILESLYAGRACAPRPERRSTACAPCPPVSDPGCGVLRLEVGEDDKVSFPITVRNSCRGEQTATVILPVFKDHASMTDEDELLTVTLSVNGKPYKAGTGFIVRDTARLRVAVKVAHNIPKNHTYEARVNISFSNAEPQSCRLQLYTVS